MPRLYSCLSVWVRTPQILVALLIAKPAEIQLVVVPQENPPLRVAGSPSASLAKLEMLRADRLDRSPLSAISAVCYHHYEFEVRPASSVGTENVHACRHEKLFSRRRRRGGLIDVLRGDQAGES